MKIFTIVGARPQFVKAAVISREIRNFSSIDEIIVHTGQHFDKNMSEIFFDEMDIPKPDYNLQINSLSHGAMTGRMLEGIEEILINEKPDWVIVYGDTNSTLAGAIASSKLGIPLAHVEAGLRSYNMSMPEEVNRILTDRISNFLFCPTETAVSNLHDEGYKNIGSHIELVGDVMKDAALFYKERSKKPLVSLPDKFILATVHRAENTNDLYRFTNIVKALNELHSSKIPIVMPLHPRTRNCLNQFELSLDIILIDPVGYIEMIWLLENCESVITDSGGLQKEAYMFKKYCFTLRDQTEWVELLASGQNILVDVSKSDNLLEAYRKKSSFENTSNSIYGNGKAATKILNSLLANNVA
jgi:UDP-GlcNAc3NAcA epimerase